MAATATATATTIATVVDTALDILGEQFSNIGTDDVACRQAMFLALASILDAAYCADDISEDLRNEVYAATPEWVAFFLTEGFEFEADKDRCADKIKRGDFAWIERQTKQRTTRAREALKAGDKEWYLRLLASSVRLLAAARAAIAETTC